MLQNFHMGYSDSGKMS